MEATDWFEEHVLRFNEGVRTGNFDAMARGFAPDALMSFRGVPVGPFAGREAIAEAYRTQPPTDQLIVLGIEDSSPDRFTVRYAWAVAPEAMAGRIRCEFGEDGIRRMEISFGSE